MTETPVPSQTPTPTSTNTPAPTRTAYPPPIIDYFRASPDQIAAGDCTWLEWGSVTNATAATIDQGIGGVATPGSRQVCPAETTTYILTATGPGGTTSGSVTVRDAAIQDVMQQLTDLFLGEVEDPVVREALRHASVTRRITRSLLRALSSGDEKTFESLQRLPFIDTWRDGLRIHDAVHEAMARTLHASDPERYHDSRRRAWRQSVGRLWTRCSE